MTTILILDYNDFSDLYENVIESKFSGLKFNICKTEDIEEFYSLFDKYQNDVGLIIIDKSRSVGQAEEMVNHIRNINKSVGIIFVSSWEDNTELESMKDKSLINAYLIKPFQLEEFYPLLEEAINR
jgi:two-component SAPR family response regulator